MLYATTRNNVDAYTCARALRGSRGSDGGLYVPFRLPVMTSEDVLALGEKGVSAVMADMLNLLFGTHVTAWEVACCIGHSSVRLTPLTKTILVGECWHNPEGTLGWTVTELTKLLSKEESHLESGSWSEVGIRIAVLSGLFAQLIRSGVASDEKKVDISVVSGDFSSVMSAWYAREMGLPIGNIICSCNDNNAIWDLMHHGQLRTDLLAVNTNTPDADFMIPLGLERLIHASGGASEVQRYLEACRRGGMYCPDERVLESLRRGMHVSVVSQRRVMHTIPSVYGAHRYVLSPYGALAYGGLLDYRVRTGENRLGLVLAEKSPLCDAEVTAQALGIPADALKQYL